MKTNCLNRDFTMLSFRVSLLLLMVTLAMVIKTANSRPPLKLEVSIKKSNPSGDNTKHQDSVRLVRARTGRGKILDPLCLGLVGGPLVAWIYAMAHGCY